MIDVICNNDLIEETQPGTDLTNYGYDGYSLTRDGKVWSKKTNTWIGDYERGTVEFLINGIRYSRVIRDLMAQVYGTELDSIPDSDKRNLEFMGYPMYTITRDGRLWTHHYHRYIKLGIGNTDYYCADLRPAFNGKSLHHIHRLVALAFIPNPENKPFVNHIDGNKLNPEASNLEWCTHQENTDHAILTGLKPSVVDEAQVREICKLLEQNHQPTAISKMLDVPRTVARDIKHKNTWVHISNEYNIPKPGFIYQTDETIHAVCKRLEQGGSTTVIAKELNLDKNFVHGCKGGFKSYAHIISQYNIPEVKAPPKMDEVMIRTIAQAFACGYSTTEIKEITGASISSIWKIIKQQSYKSVSEQYDYDHRDAWARLRNNGLVQLNGPNADEYIEHQWCSTDPVHTLDVLDCMDSVESIQEMIERDIEMVYR